MVKSDSFTRISDSWRSDFGRSQYEGVATLNNRTEPSAHTGTTMVEVMRSLSIGLSVAMICGGGTIQRLLKGECSALLRYPCDLLPKLFRFLQHSGYLNASSTKIGYIFRTPKHAAPQSEPISLHRILSEVKSAADIPELGTRFDIAKAIATTVFEFHNIGWLHKKIDSTDILFWPCKDHNGILDLWIPY